MEHSFDGARSFDGAEVTPGLLRSLEGEATLETLVIRGGPLTTIDLEPLSRLTKLKGLVVADMRIDDGVFRYLQPLRSLEYLNLAYTGVRGDFSPLTGLPLQDIRLEGCRLVSDPCAKTLADFPGLRQL